MDIYIYIYMYKYIYIYKWTYNYMYWIDIRTHTHIYIYIYKSKYFFMVTCWSLECRCPTWICLKKNTGNPQKWCFIIIETKTCHITGGKKTDASSNHHFPQSNCNISWLSTLYVQRNRICLQLRHAADHPKTYRFLVSTVRKRNRNTNFQWDISDD